MTETPPTDLPDRENETEWSENETTPNYPERPDNPHNHRYTVSWDPTKAPFLVVRGQTARDLLDCFAELREDGVYAAMGDAWRELKAQAAIGAGLGPTTPAPAPQGPPAPPQGGPNYHPQMPPPGAPGSAPAPWQNAGAPPAPPQGQWGGSGGGGGSTPPADWYRLNVPFQAQEAFKATAAQCGIRKGNPGQGGQFNFWKQPVKAWYCAPEVAQAFSQFGPVPA